MDRRIFVCAKKGESAAFIEPFLEFPTRIDLPEFMDKIKASGDDRSFVLVSALCVEAYLHELMNCLSPGFAVLKQNRDFTFSTKLQLLKALQLIPPHITAAADLIRRVRNLFAHDLQIESLSGIDPKLRAAMRQVVRDAFGERPDGNTDRQDFEQLNSLALVGLYAYRANFKKLRNKLLDEALIETWKMECDAELKATIARITSEDPIEVTIQDGHVHKRYREGLVNVEPIEATKMTPTD